MKLRMIKKREKTGSSALVRGFLMNIAEGG